MSDRRMTRRQFLTAAGAVGAAVAGPALLGCRPHRVGVCPAVPPSPFVRRDVGNLAATDPVIVSYRKAVAAMRALPASDPRSWSYQAAIHGTVATPDLPGWNGGTHGSPFFWPWHRMYLYWFERIVRKLSGDSCWTLPYWNWSAASERQLPAPFRDTTSELFTAERHPAMNDGTGSLPASSVAYASGFGFTSFATASAVLEGTPHAAVHVGVGGWMGSVPTAAQDPIFYLHHCNLDRLWNMWLAQGGGRTNPLADATWTDTAFTFFDENGAAVTMKSCDVLRAANQLHYGYEEEPTQVGERCGTPVAAVQEAVRETVVRASGPPVVLGAKPVTFSLDLATIRRRARAAAESPTDAVLLQLDDVEADRQPGVVWQVYLGLPEGAAFNPNGPYYVGTLALFGTGLRDDAHHCTPAKVTLRINEALRWAFTQRTSRVPVKLVPTGLDVNGARTMPEPAANVRIGHVSVMIERQTAAATP